MFGHLARMRDKIGNMEEEGFPPLQELIPHLVSDCYCYAMLNLSIPDVVCQLSLLIMHYVL